MFKFYKKADRKVLLFAVLLFAAFAVLAFLFPYSGDDWAWGSSIGAERLENWFEDYNGRYAGNLLVMALTRNKLLCAAVMAALLTFSCILPSLFAKAKDFTALSLGAFLLLFIPKDVFVQSVVWTSGFSNYVPPVLLTLLYFVIIKNIFEDEKPHYSPVLSIVSPLLGFVGALFMENVTVFNLAAALFVIIYTARRFRKVCAVHLMYFIGCALGAVLMFTNSAYRLIAKQEDFYRSTFIERGFIDTVTENIKGTFEDFIASDIIALGVLSALCIVIYLLFSKRNTDGRKKRIALTALNVNLICLGAAYCKSRLYDWNLFFDRRGYAVVTVIILLIIGSLYFISTLALVYICVDCKITRRKVIFLLLCAFGVIAPLILVNPIGPRCFFPPYAFIMCVCVMLSGYIKQKGVVSVKVDKILGRLLTAMCAVMLCFLTGVYGVIHHYDVRRTDYVKKQADEGFKTVLVYYLPFDGFVWNGNPDSVPWDESYKKYYGLDDSIKFKFVLWEAFDAFTENFEEK